MRPLILTIFLSMILMQTAFSQTLNAYVKGADDAMAKKDYFSAYNFLRTAHEIEPNNTEITYKLAEAARHYSAFTRAEAFYTEVDSSKNAADFPATGFWLGYVKERLGKYQEALDLYNIYISEHSEEDPELTAMARKHIEISKWAIEALKTKDTIYTYTHLGSEVNTTFSEFGARGDSNLLYYTSLRFLLKESAHPEKPYSKILKREDQKVGEIDTLLNDNFLHTANFTLNGAKDRVYYSLCEYINASEIRCNLYYRDIVDGVFGIAQKLPEPINMTGYTNTQPYIGYDSLKQKEVLYFISDRPGGKGKADIWFCNIADRDNFSPPENLTALNTPSTEQSPYYNRETNTFYFSSDGYLGFGGLDIYSVDITKGIWGTPVDMGTPMNSSLDDAFFTLSEDGKKGYFSSNRLGSMYLSPEDEACCYDIYQIDKIDREKPPRVVMVRTFEKRNRLPLEGVKVDLSEIPSGYSDVRQETFAYRYIYVLEPDKDFQATGTKKGYLPDSRTFNSSEQPELDTLIIDLFLDIGNLEDFLPLAIYFDNDVPGRKSKSETATERYLETYGPYMALREEFIQKYSGGAPQDQKEAATRAITQFFDVDLATGKREFESFMHILEQYLNEGLTFTIYLKGYTSPLASKEYNKSLGNRRISSIQNEFKSFREGILWKYMETGDLVVTQKSFGEETAPATVSDDRRNVRKSIYSPEASRERRVEIIEIAK